jgi:hypothetical protein
MGRFLMPILTIRIKKNADGSAALSCTRADGTVTWQRQLGVHGQFFPRHDLTHYAVETTLGFRDAFYGLVASGWDISDFGPPWPRGRIPETAGIAELIVGFLDAERASTTRWTAADFNDKATIYYRDHSVSTTPPTLTDDDLARIRQRRAELFAEWDAVAAGGTLELTFVPDGEAAPTPPADAATHAKRGKSRTR